MKAKLTLAYWTARAFLNNAYVEFQNARLEKLRRKWTAYKIGGGGVVPLGKVNQETAIEKTCRFGQVAFVDSEVAVIFYSDKTTK
jgi:hypothetical protein